MSTIIKEHSWGRDSKGKRWDEYDTIVCPDGEVIDMQKLIEEQQRAKAALVHLYPAFGDFVNKLTMVYTFRVKTQATDGRYVFVNPQFTSHLDFSQKAFVYAHEIMHCLLNHLRRAKAANFDHEKANIAGDYEINISLTDLELFDESTVKKTKALYNKKYSGWGFEKIYNDNPSGSIDSMEPDKNSSNNESGQEGSGGQYSEDYIKGWQQACKDYKEGKLKL